MEPVRFTIALFVTLTVATTVITYAHEIKIRNAKEKDSLLKKAQIVIDENGHQTVHLYDERGVELGSESYNKYIIKGITKEAKALQKEIEKSHKETENLQKELFKTREELQRSKEEASKYKAKAEMDVVNSLKLGSSAESSSAGLDEADRPMFSVTKSRTLSFSSTEKSLKDLQLWLKKDSKEEFKVKKSSVSHSHSGTSSREDLSTDESSYIKSRSSSFSSLKISSICERDESDLENLDSAMQADPDKTFHYTSRSLGNPSSLEARKDDSCSHKTTKKSLSNPVIARRPHKNDIDKSLHEKDDGVEVKILKLKSTMSPEVKRKLNREPDKYSNEKSDHSNVETKFHSTAHTPRKHKNDLDKTPDGFNNATSKSRLSSDIDTKHRSEKSPEAVKAKILKFKSSLTKSSSEKTNDFESKQYKVQNSAVSSEFDNKGNNSLEKASSLGVKFSKLKSSMSPEREDKDRKVEVKSSITTTLNSEIKIPDLKSNLGWEHEDKDNNVEIIIFTQKTEVTELAKLMDTARPKELTRNLEKPTSLSLVKSDGEVIFPLVSDNVIDLSFQDDRRTNGELLKTSGSRSNLQDGNNTYGHLSNSKLKSTNSNSELSPALELRMQQIHNFITASESIEENGTNLSGEHLLESLP